MAAQPGDQTTRIWIGAGKVGAQLKETLKALAKREKKNSVSRLLVDAAIEKYEIDRETGRIKE